MLLLLLWFCCGGCGSVLMVLLLWFCSCGSVILEFGFWIFWLRSDYSMKYFAVTWTRVGGFWLHWHWRWSAVVARITATRSRLTCRKTFSFRRQWQHKGALEMSFATVQCRWDIAAKDLWIVKEKLQCCSWDVQTIQSVWQCTTILFKQAGYIAVLFEVLVLWSRCVMPSEICRHACTHVFLMLDGRGIFMLLN